MTARMISQIKTSLAALGVVGIALAAIGCSQQRPSADPPVHLVPNMDNQPRYETQGPGPFFADGMAMRHPVPGTIARGNLVTDAAMHTGRNAQGQLLAHSPIPVTSQLLARGQDRFDIFCTPCHGRAGDGEGAIGKRGMLPPPTFHDARLRSIEDGHLFDVMTNGKGNMATYRHQVSTYDRWAIVSYIRALQRSQNASVADLPPAPQATDTESPAE